MQWGTQTAHADRGAAAGCCSERPGVGDLCSCPQDECNIAAASVQESDDVTQAAAGRRGRLSICKARVGGPRTSPRELTRPTGRPPRIWPPTNSHHSRSRTLKTKPLVSQWTTPSPGSRRQATCHGPSRLRPNTGVRQSGPNLGVSQPGGLVPACPDAQPSGELPLHNGTLQRRQMEGGKRH